MLGLRLPEILLILGIALLVFGPTKLGDLGGALGRGIRNFKREMNGVEEDRAQASLQGANSANGQVHTAATEKQSS